MSSAPESQKSETNANGLWGACSVFCHWKKNSLSSSPKGLSPQPQSPSLILTAHASVSQPQPQPDSSPSSQQQPITVQLTPFHPIRPIQLPHSMKPVPDDATSGPAIKLQCRKKNIQKHKGEIQPSNHSIISWKNTISSTMKRIRKPKRINIFARLKFTSWLKIYCRRPTKFFIFSSFAPIIFAFIHSFIQPGIGSKKAPNKRPFPFRFVAKKKNIAINLKTAQHPNKRSFNENFEGNFKGSFNNRRPNRKIFFAPKQISNNNMKDWIKNSQPKHCNQSN